MHVILCCRMCSMEKSWYYANFMVIWSINEIHTHKQIIYNWNFIVTCIDDVKVKCFPPHVVIVCVSNFLSLSVDWVENSLNKLSINIDDDNLVIYQIIFYGLAYDSICIPHKIILSSNWKSSQLLCEIFYINRMTLFT
jgi:hypothetical protein